MIAEDTKTTGALACSDGTACTTKRKQEKISGIAYTSIETSVFELVVYLNGWMLEGRSEASCKQYGFTLTLQGRSCYVSCKD